MLEEYSSPSRHILLDFLPRLTPLEIPLPLSLLSSYSTTLSIHPSNPLDLQCHVGRLVGCQTERFAAPPPRNGEFARVCVSSLEEGCGEKIFDINNQ